MKSSACIVSPLHHRNQPSGRVLKFVLLPRSVPLILAIPSSLRVERAIYSEITVFKGEKESMRGTKGEVTVVTETGNFAPTLIVYGIMFSLCMTLRERK